MAVGSVRGVIIGVLAGPLLLIVTKAGAGSDASGAGFILAAPMLGAVAGFLLGLAIPLFCRFQNADDTEVRPWALILAVAALVLAVVGVAVLLVDEYWTVVGCYAGLCVAVLALLCAYPAAGKLPSRRRLALRLALVALVLNGAALAGLPVLSWLVRESHLPRPMQQEKSTVAPARSRSPGSTGISPVGPAATRSSPPRP
jgi:hypothetical protein